MSQSPTPCSGPSEADPREARCFGRYLLGRDPDPTSVNLYERAVRDRRGCALGPEDRRLLAFVLGHPAWLGPVDGALALTRPRSALRQRLLVMTAVLEARPEYAALFLPGGGSLMLSTVSGMRAAVHAVAGLLLLRFI